MLSKDARPARRAFSSTRGKRGQLAGAQLCQVLCGKSKMVAWEGGRGSAVACLVLE